MLHKLRDGLPSLPARIARLPIDARGYPVPWFVQWFHADKTPVVGRPDLEAGDYPDHRVVDSRKFESAVRMNWCWVCGEVLGKHLAFTLGAMCVVTRASAEPPSHLDCATFSACGCPFLSRPHAVRREADQPAGVVEPAGHMLKRNPGVVAVWSTRRYDIFRAGPDGKVGGWLVAMGPADAVFWYCEGRVATRVEILHSITTGLPPLKQQAALQGPESVIALSKDLERALLLIPADGGLLTAEGVVA